MTTVTPTNAARPQLLAGVANADLAAALLRVTTGGLFLAHAWLKLVIYTPAGTVGFFESIGFPGFLAYLVIAAELVGGVALIAGVWTRWVSLALVPVLLGSIYARTARQVLLRQPGRRLGIPRSGPLYLSPRPCSGTAPSPSSATAPDTSPRGRGIKIAPHPSWEQPS